MNSSHAKVLLTISRLLSVALWLSMISVAQAQTGSNSPPASADAYNWGYERSVSALAKLIDFRYPSLIDSYASGFHQANVAIYRTNGSKPIPLPDGMEDLIIQNYGDPVVGAHLRGLFTWEGVRYQSRALFDALYADYDLPAVIGERYRGHATAMAITKTDLRGIEQLLLAVLKRERRPALQNDYYYLIQFLAAREYVPLLPVLRTILEDAPAGEQVAITCIEVLQKRNPGMAAEAAIQRLTRLRAQYLAVNTNQEVEAMISAIVGAPANDTKGIEPALLEWVKAARATSVSRDISRPIDYLARRDYLPAVPILLGFARESTQTDPMWQVVLSALLKLDPEGAGDAAMGRLERLLAGESGASAFRDVSALLSILSQIPPATRLDLAALETASPESLGEFGYYFLDKIFRARNDARLVPISMRFLSDAKQLAPAVQAIIDFGAPAVWLQARQEIDRLQQSGKLTEVQTRHALSLLDANLADPPKFIAERKQEVRRQRFTEKLSVLRAAGNARQEAKAMTPEQYIRSAVESAEALTKLTMEFSDLPQATGQVTEAAMAYLSAGNVARFSLRQPLRALEYYAKAQAGSPTLATLAAADTFQFDLRDKVRALAEYQRLLDQKPNFNIGNELEVSMLNWSRKWLGAQIKFLKSGRKFTGPINQDDISGLGTFLYIGAAATSIPLDPFGLAALSHPSVDPKTDIIASASRIDREGVIRKLPTLPASIFVLAATFEHFPLLRDANAILRYLDRHDPVGFASASILGMALLMDSQKNSKSSIALHALTQTEERKSSILVEAAEQFSRERKISLRQPIDPRLASPEMTWNLLIASLKAGDIDTAMLCLTPNMQSRFRPLFTGMTKEALREMAESFTGFGGASPLGENAYEAYATRGTLAGSIQFQKANGMWRIVEM